MNAKLTVKVVALGLLAVQASDAGLELPDGMDAEIDELIAAADEYATDIPNDEADVALTEVITEMLDAIKAELGGQPTVTITREEYDRFTHDSEMLGCLEACGVDNWCGWDDAMELFTEGEDAL